MYRKFFKRFLDVFLSGLALLILALPLLILALLVRCKLGSPIFFTQLRSGKNERIFRMYKFRSMTDARDAYGNLLPDKERLTKFGRLLRATSLDELPELFNIFKGDMSIIGPRPLSILYLPDYTPESRRRHEVRPGLTGYAQVNGRNNLPWDDRFRLDVEYIDNLTFLMDCKILVNTVLKVLRRSDIVLRGTKDYTLHRMLQEEGALTMQTKEIGSNFSMEQDVVPEGIAPETLSLDWLPSGDDRCMTLSGRAAIGLALADIQKQKTVKIAYVPAYSCISMLQPFLDAGVEIVFYDVSVKDGAVCYEIDPNTACDVVLAMSYFGLSDAISDAILGAFRKKGVSVIEDVTHRMMSGKAVSAEADYAAASLRKWFAVPAGGCLVKRSGKLAVATTDDSADAMQVKIEAMCDKRDYLKGMDVSKEDFLEKFYRGDRVLAKVRDNLKIDPVSAAILQETDAEAVRQRRIENAKVIYERLRSLPLQPMIAQPDWTQCCPLFVPVLLPTEERDALRKHLIENGIYCPVHWPEVMGAKVGLRANELSLICDQRYTAADMERMMDCVAAWYAEQKQPATVG